MRFDDNGKPKNKFRSVANQNVRAVIDKGFCHSCVSDKDRYKITFLNVGAFKPSEDVCWVNVWGGGDLPPLKPHPFYIQVTPWVTHGALGVCNELFC